MRKSILSFIAALLLAGGGLQAQETNLLAPERGYRPEALYASFGAGGFLVAGPALVGSTRITGLLVNGLGLSLGMRNALRSRINDPEEFHLSSTATGEAPGLDAFRIIDLSAVKKFWVRGARQQLRLGIEAGPALVNTQVYTFTAGTPVKSSFSTIPYYLANPNTQNVVGLQVTLNATYVPAQVVGLELALWGNVNASQYMLGIDGHLLLGRLKRLRGGQR